MSIDRDGDEEESQESGQDTQRAVLICVLARLLHSQAEGYSLAETIGHLIQHFSSGLTLQLDSGHRSLDPDDLILAYDVMQSLRSRLSDAQLYRRKREAMDAYKAVWGCALRQTLAVMQLKNEDGFS